ncbi:hypothetical protein BS78_02G134100 [Paspalum vaginatum]|nr:hypothetical protein BS78_02G134100 [Paspalum vaginatum]
MQMYMHRESRKMDNRDDEFILQQMIRDGMHDEQNASHDTDIYLNLEDEAPYNIDEDTGAPENANKDTGAPKNANKDISDPNDLVIEEVEEDGQPLSPAIAATKFVNYCGYLVRDHVPISFRTWRPTCVNDPHAVPKAQKAMLWDIVKQKFNIPKELHEKVEDWTLKKMDTLFQSHKKKLYEAFTKHGKAPDFKALPKYKGHWDVFLRYKYELERYAKEAGVTVEQLLRQQEFESAEEVSKYEYGKPLVKPELYMKKSKAEKGYLLVVRVKDIDYFNGIDLMYLYFKDIYEVYHQGALDVTLVSC